MKMICGMIDICHNKECHHRVEHEETEGCSSAKCEDSLWLDTQDDLGIDDNAYCREVVTPRLIEEEICQELKK